MNCSNCSGQSRVTHGNYQFKECGLDNVVLCGIEIVKCAECENEDPIIPAINELFQVIALALLTKPYGLAGEEVRYLRKYMRLTGDQFSRLLHVDRTTLSKWENNEDRVGNQSDLAIRMLAMSHNEGLRNRIQEIVKQFEKIQFCSERKNKRKKYIPKRPKIEVNASDLSYAYA